MDRGSHSPDSVPANQAEADAGLPCPSDPIDIPTMPESLHAELIEPNSPPGKNQKAHEPAPTALQELMMDREKSRMPLSLGDTEPLPRLSSDDADTLVYIDPPEPSFDMDRPITSVPHRVHSSNLLSTKPSYFERLFSPKYQSRIIKRRGLAGRLPENIKYVIDLTPPTMEEEAVIAVMELSCPLGVRSWATKRSRWDLPAQCVDGIDEYEPADLQLLLSQGKTSEKQEDQRPMAEEERPDKDTLNNKVEAKEKDRGNNKGKGKERVNDKPTPKPTPKPKPNTKPILPIEYSPSRHRRAIEQILHALEGHEVALDTPCKVWTFFSLANLFEVASAPRICDPILAWFYESTNTRFIELNPEISYRVACGIKCSSLCRIAYSILVGEEAMLLLGKTTLPADLGRPAKTTHGRIRDSLDDTKLQRVEYGSTRFMDSVVDRFAHLVGSEMSWLAKLGEYQKIINYPVESILGRDAVDGLIVALKNHVRTCIYLQLSLTMPTWTPHPLPTAADDGDYPPDSFINSYSAMQHTERIMSRTFWGSLMHEQWMDFRSEPLGASLMANLRKLPAFEGIDTWFTHVSKDEFTSRAQRFNNYIKLDFITLPPGTPNPDAFPGEPPEAGVFNDAEARVHQVDMSALYSQIYAFTTEYARQVAHPPETLEVLFPELTDVLTCLTDKDYGFLPLWAGGNDDGTGGVFTDPGIPIIEGDESSKPDPVTAGNALSEASYAMPSQGTFENTVQGAAHQVTERDESDIWSMSSLASVILNAIDALEQSYRAAAVNWQTEEDDAHTSISDTPISETPPGSHVCGDGDNSNTIDEHESISDFLNDDNSSELDLEGGHEHVHGHEDSDGDIGEGSAYTLSDGAW